MADAEDATEPPLWAAPDWRADAEAWIRGQLAAEGLEPTGAIEQPHVRWWATVLRVPTSDGDVYFKALSPSHVFEAGLTAVLAGRFPERVPRLVAVDAERGWMLMRDGGRRMRELVGSAADLWRWERVLPRYAELQIGVAPQRDELLALGTPDQRLDRLAADLERLLDDRALVLGGEEALTALEHERLRALVPEVARMCTELASLGLPETLQHDDLHDGNVFADDDGYRVFDWGDSCVSHPFHSLVVTLRSVAYRFELDPGSAELVRLRDAYLEPWTQLADPGSLAAAFDLAYRTGTIARAAAWHRYVSARAEVDADEAASIPYGLRLFLEGGAIGTYR